MKTNKNILGKLDYFSSIDRLADDFEPKKSKKFDPYPDSWARYGQRTLHLGPAQSKELNPKQVKELIHELKEKKIRDRKALEDAKEIKTLSKRFMNSPWSSVPAKYRKKYANMDFDGDGVKNSKDCYPFDYDRQGWAEDAMNGIYDFFTRKAPAQISMLVPKAPNIIPEKLQERLRTNYGTPQTLRQMNANRGIVVPEYNFYTGEQKLDYISTTNKQNKTPSDNTRYIDDTTNTVQTTKQQLDPDRLVDIYKTIKQDIYGENFDQAKYNEIYNAILDGKLNDPALKAELEAKYGPYLDAYKTKSAGIDAGLAMETKQLKGLLSVKDAQMQKIGGINLANVRPYARAQEIISERAARAQAASDAAKQKELDILSKEQARIDKEHSNKIAGLALTETQARKGEYSYYGKTGTMNQDVLKKYSELTPNEKARYDALHPNG